MGRMNFVPWLDLIAKHKQLYPLMEEQDVFKLLYQGILGSEHLISNEKRFRENLAEELAGLSPDPLQPLYKPIRPDGKLCRVDLRAWLVTGQNLDQLTNACLIAAHHDWGSMEDLKKVWKTYASSRKEASELTPFLEEKNYPALHHSEVYRTAYKPAYRLGCEFC